MSRILISNDDLSTAVSLLSAERMAGYIQIAGNMRNAIDLHDKMLQTGAALMPVTALIEIALRNAVCERLASLFDTPDWLQAPPASFVWRGQERDSIRRAKRHAQQAGYAKLNQFQKRQLDRVAYPDGLPNGLTHEERVKARRTHIEITFGQLVAQLTLGFWKRLFSADYEASLWGRSLKKLFPDPKFSRARAADSLETIYQARNRIAHHEPILGTRLEASLAAIEVFVENFGQKFEDGSTLLEQMTRLHRSRLAAEAYELNTAVAAFTLDHDR